MATLGPQAARIFRITHVNNLSWIFDNGLHCQSSNITDPNFMPIGMPGLIEKRKSRAVLAGPGGKLSDYVPFYFTPRSIMLYNIKTGYNDVIQRSNSEIVILVSSLHRMNELGLRYVFTNGHAYVAESDHFDTLANLDKIDWELLRHCDFTRDPEDPGKLVRYQAEALVHRHVPLNALLGIACFDAEVKHRLEKKAARRGLSISVKTTPQWYF